MHFRDLIFSVDVLPTETPHEFMIALDLPRDIPIGLAERKTDGTICYTPLLE
jgi:hypothetical protein